MQGMPVWRLASRCERVPVAVKRNGDNLADRREKLMASRLLVVVTSWAVPPVAGLAQAVAAYDIEVLPPGEAGNGSEVAALFRHGCSPLSVSTIHKSHTWQPSTYPLDGYPPHG